MTDKGWERIADNRFVLTSFKMIDRAIESRIGMPFAFDVETSGLDPRRDQLLGLALTFADGNSFYIPIAHTEVVGRVVSKTVQVEQHDWVQEPVILKSGKQSVDREGNPRFKRVKQTTLVDKVVEEDQREYPLKTYLSGTEFAALLGRLFQQPEVVMIAHNIKFDVHFLDRAGVALTGRLVDTMLAAKLINENREVGLKELSRTLLGREDMVDFTSLDRYPAFGRDEFLGVPLRLAADYAMRDTEATFALWERFSVELEEEGVESAYYDMWMPLCMTLFEMERVGVSIDIDLVRKTKDDYEQRKRAAEKVVWRTGMEMVLDRSGGDPARLLEMPSYLVAAKGIVGDVEDEEFVEVDDGLILPVVRKESKAYQPRIPWFNSGSNPQVQELLYDYLGLKPPNDVKLRKTENGMYSVDAQSLKTLAFYLGDQTPEALTSLLEYRKAEKFIGTYLDRFISDADPDNHWAIYTSFNQHVADTGRLSSSGPNLQNIPSRGEEGKQARNMFRARPKMKLVVADYGQMELRAIAHYSNDPVLLKAFAEGLDLHVLTGAGQAGMTYEELLAKVESGDSEAKQLRAIGKTSNFGLSYGMGAKKYKGTLLVMNSLDVDVDEAQRLIDQYNETYAGVTAWKEEVVRRLKSRGWVMTLEGRKRRLPEIWDNDKLAQLRAERQGINSIIQGSCADIIGLAIPNVQSALREMGGYLLLQVHDEIVAEVPEDCAEQAAALIGRLMTEPVNARLRCPMVADAHVGDTWGDAKG